ncbi:MAG: GlsB/YeaQ/YmgE family stress response membrane protein [Candidatus Rokuibacteriota bacterium]|nr:MAG: GlsB/YeaQ/YmgE family stress response membrane protein [Candidatus Rokubacteria bacterium]
MHLVMFIVIGLIAGSLAGRVMSGHGYGVLGDIILGGIGALLGGWMFATLRGIGGSGFFISLVMAFVGASVLLWLIRLIAPLRA